jgi:imidazolonepropionase-like amidohydrolase
LNPGDSMRRQLLLSLVFLSLPALASATSVFVNVNVVPMTSERIDRNQTVVVTDGMVASIGDVESIPIPEGALVVDGTDRYLIPGLAEMHAHVPPGNSPDLDRVLTLFAANGVTTIRGMLGHVSHLALRQQLLAGETFGPRLITSGPSLNGNSVSGAEDGARQVRAQRAAGYDFIKIHPGLTSSEFSAIAKTANELGIPFAGHVPAAVGVDGAMVAGIATIDHLDGYFAALMPFDNDPSGGYGGFFDVLLADKLDTDRISELASRTAAARTWNVPTESVVEHRISTVTTADLRSRPEMRYMPRATVAQWTRAKERQESERGFNAGIAARAIQVRRSLILALHEEGAGLLLGSDAPQVFNVPGFSIHRELAFLVAAGLTPYQALRTGTTAVAEFLGSNTGTVAVGREADLVLLDADPLEEIGNSRRIHGVMLRGVWHPHNDLEQRLSVFIERDD